MEYIFDVRMKHTKNFILCNFMVNFLFNKKVIEAKNLISTAHMQFLFCWVENRHMRWQLELSTNAEYNKLHSSISQCFDLGTNGETCLLCALSDDVFFSWTIFNTQSFGLIKVAHIYALIAALKAAFSFLWWITTFFPLLRLHRQNSFIYFPVTRKYQYWID